MVIWAFVQLLVEWADVEILCKRETLCVLVYVLRFTAITYQRRVKLATTKRLPVSKLLRWAQKHLRDLPWRIEPRDPYRVWISEMMLQQTQVATVIPYFRRFTERFPTVEALAAAPLDDVLKLWEGLGYYARARNLHRAARQVVAEFDGHLPDTVEELSTTARHWPYTAGAIASIAFGRDAPVVDGNVKRVLCRVYAIRGDARRPAIQKKLWALAATNLPKGKAGRWNEAMMELGATVCSPRSPRCDECPLAEVCRARALGIQEQLPTKATQKRLPHYDVTAAVIRKRGRVLIAQRPVGGMLGGLWEFPGGKRRARRVAGRMSAARNQGRVGRRD